MRPAALRLQPVVHGSVAAAELALHGLTPSQVLDFSANLNPLGPAPSVVRAARSADWTRYPGDDEAPLRARLAERASVQPDQVALGNGSTELLWLLALATLGRDRDRAAVVAPTYGEYARAARAAGAEVVEVADPGAAGPVRLLFICNPNNPTGDYHARATIERVLRDDPDRLVVLDESYALFVDERWPSEPLLAYANLALVRSMTKDHAIPGLRLGYLLAAPAVARAVEAVRPPWSVNAGALRAGLATLEPEATAHLERARSVVRASRRLLVDGFTQLGFAVRPSAANFVLVEVGDGAAFRRALLPRGFVVRDCASFGLPGFIRVACRRPRECRRLLDAVEQALPELRPGGVRV